MASSDYASTPDCPRCGSRRKNVGGRGCDIHVGFHYWHDALKAENARLNEQLAELKRGRPRPSALPLVVEVFYQEGDDPFIYAAQGHIGGCESLQEMQEEIRRSLEFDRGPGCYVVALEYFDGQRGESDDIRWEIPPGWTWTDAAVEFYPLEPEAEAPPAPPLADDGEAF